MKTDMPTFAGGEIGDDLVARSDTAKYRTALRRARNVLIATAGGVYNRPGMMFAGEVYDSARKTRTVTFQFSVNQGYALELGHQTLRVVTQGGYVLRKELIVTAISNAEYASVTVDGPHGYQIGWDVVLSGILGMTEINGLKGRVLFMDATSMTLDINTTDFGVFTGDSGDGVPGDDQGGEGGDPPPPAPLDPPEETPPFVDEEPPPPVYGLPDGFWLPWM